MAQFGVAARQRQSAARGIGQRGPALGALDAGSLHEVRATLRCFHVLLCVCVCVCVCVCALLPGGTPDNALSKRLNKG